MNDLIKNKLSSCVMVGLEILTQSIVLECLLQLKSLDLSNNGLRGLKSFFGLGKKAPHLLQLNLGNNKVSLLCQLFTSNRLALFTTKPSYMWKNCFWITLLLVALLCCKEHSAVVHLVLQRLLLLSQFPVNINHQQGPSVNEEYLSQIQLHSIFGELPVLSSTVLIITVCVKVANSTFLVTNKRTKWAELSRYYLCNCFVW